MRFFISILVSLLLSSVLAAAQDSDTPESTTPESVTHECHKNDVRTSTSLFFRYEISMSRRGANIK